MAGNKDWWHEHTFQCSCGKMHVMPIKEIYVGGNAFELIKMAPVKYNLGRKVLVVLDNMIYKILGKILKDTLESSYCIVDFIIFKDNQLKPDEKGLTQVLIKYSDDVDFFVAAGSGAVNDITRYYSYKLNKPYISIPTAASIDGYSANVALLYINGLKQTYEATYPLAIFSDSNILAKAPVSLFASGCGDLYAKISACTDWEISNIVNGEYFCKYACDTIDEVIKACSGVSDALVKRECQAAQILMEGLLISGIVMHWVGSSRPAAGAEHHLTHFWGMQTDGPIHLHGIECAVGTLIMGELYQYLLKTDFKQTDIAKQVKRLSDKEQWGREINAVFKTQADIIFSQNKDKDFSPNTICARLENIIAHEAGIKEIIEKRLKQFAELKHLLELFNCPSTPQQLGIHKDMVKKSLMHAKEIRSKYTVLDLLWDIGTLESAVNEILSI